MLPGLSGAMFSSGAGAGNVTLNGGTVTSYGSGVRTASYRIDSDQFVYYGDNGAYTSNHRWTSDPVAGYEARLTVDLGSTPSGTATATWLALTSDRTWTITGSTIGVSDYAETTVQIRDATSLAVVATAVIYIIAERS